ncbi:hypothetical protein JYK18_30655 [Amycolatopsis sp. 195334CR]|nr:hypothetical protein [Amycolatopsis sp. 195334CR]
MDGMASLRHAIETVPIPGAPPRLSHNGAAVGLALLDTALRLNHVRRLTERLTVVEHGTARRSTDVDISLKLLDEGQRQATSNLQDLIGREHGERTVSRPGVTTLWVPIARLPRSSVSPVDVYDGTGEKLPRLTQHETSRLLASGLYRLLRGILASDEHAHSPKQDLSAFLFRLHEPRWLIQRALLTLLTERDHPAEEFTHPPADGLVAGHGRQCRDMALRILDGYGHLLAEYAQLLDVAVRDYLLVIALDDNVDEHRLNYETPLYVSDDRPRRFAEYWRRVRASHSGYFARYDTTIPATLRSYHLVVQTAPEVDLTRLYLTTDADGPLAHNLAADLKSLAGRELTAGKTAAGKILELQTQTVLRQLADLLRRRKWEASRSGVELPETALPVTHRLAAAATTGEAVRLAGNDVDNALLRHPAVDAENLRTAAEEVTGRELGQDLVVVGNFTDNQAQAYWRRSAGEGGYGEQVRIRAGLVLKDSGEAGPRSVMFYALAVAATAWGLGWLLVGSPLPYGRQATEALGNVGDGQSVITMLLLVPGFLYTRLALPPRRSVAAYLRTLPRTLGQLCIVSPAGLAAAIAAQSRGEVVQVFLTIAVVLPVLTALILFSLRSWRVERVPLTRIAVPKWAGNGPIAGKPLPPNVRFGPGGGLR